MTMILTRGIYYLALQTEKIRDKRQKTTGIRVCFELNFGIRTCTMRGVKWHAASLLLLLCLSSVATWMTTIIVGAEETTTTTEAPAVVVSIEIEIPIRSTTIQAAATAAAAAEGGGGEDQYENCQTWASEGECHNNPNFMLEHCTASCNNNNNNQSPNQQQKRTAFVYEGEDASAGAFRFAEEYLTPSLVVEEQAATTQIVLDVAQQLEEALAAAATTNKEYTGPAELLTHCGNKRPCSAGKLWKRAEEMRQADMHDAAGADLIRALLKKTGLEMDFIERCQTSLHWALGSLARQREREQKEAVEEAKLEERREEERVAMEAAKVGVACMISGVLVE